MAIVHNCGIIKAHVFKSVISLAKLYGSVCSDLAPGNDEIHEETQEKFLTPGNPQEGQVILYKVHGNFIPEDFFLRSFATFPNTYFYYCIRNI